MKHNFGLTLVIIIGIIIIGGCAQQDIQPEDIQPSKAVKLNLTITEWTWGPPGEASQTNSSYIIEVKEGEKFGPGRYYVGACWDNSTEPFMLLEIIDENNISVQYEGLVLEGESIGEPSQQNLIYVSAQETCFITPTVDSGSKICLKITK